VRFVRRLPPRFETRDDLREIGIGIWGVPEIPDGPVIVELGVVVGLMRSIWPSPRR